MSMIVEERSSDSPFVEKIMHGYTVSAGSSIRPAESHWHMVLVKHAGAALPLIVGPWTAAGVASWGEGGEILWIKFKLGVYLRPLPLGHFLDSETGLPDAGSQSFWLHGSAWPFPDYENVETFIDRLVRDDALVHDPVVDVVLQGHLTGLSPRTVRHRFLQATGLTRSRIFQIERAQQAAALLENGVSILDAVDELGYYDQPHLTRSLKQWVGRTPAQIQQVGIPRAAQIQELSQPV